ncbi:hypothetical protein HX868_26355 [Pseudomonas reactans]|nr:hypothetical protein [Pseudomonas reactans]
MWCWVATKRTRFGCATWWNCHACNWGNSLRSSQ